MVYISVYPYGMLCNIFKLEKKIIAQKKKKTEGRSNRKTKKIYTKQHRNYDIMLENVVHLYVGWPFFYYFL